LDSESNCKNCSDNCLLCLNPEHCIRCKPRFALQFNLDKRLVCFKKNVKFV
jgi:hypothetical protein